MSRRKSKKRIVNQKGLKGRRPEIKANTHYKDTVFRMLFRDKKQLLGLYNAVSGRHYRNPDQLEIVTLEGVVYMGMKNDLAVL